MHINSELIRITEFIEEERPCRTTLVSTFLIKMVNVFWVHFLHKCMIKVIILTLREKKFMKDYVKNTV